MDPWAGIVEGPGWTAEVSMSVANPIRQVMFRASGDGDTWTGLRKLCEKRGWRALDVGEWAFVESAI